MWLFGFCSFRKQSLYQLRPEGNRGAVALLNRSLSHGHGSKLVRYRTIAPLLARAGRKRFQILDRKPGPRRLLRRPDAAAFM
jgi:hypothetical protein